jgi:hypothetical protein
MDSELLLVGCIRPAGTGRRDIKMSFFKNDVNHENDVSHTIAPMGATFSANAKTDKSNFRKSAPPERIEGATACDRK